LDKELLMTRRSFFGRSATGIGVAALASLLKGAERIGGLDGVPHHMPSAKRVIYLFQSGLHNWKHLITSRG
jgi:hypothetical protein